MLWWLMFLPVRTNQKRYQISHFSRNDVISCIDTDSNEANIFPQDRGEAVSVMTKALQQFLQKSNSDRCVAGVIGVGGSGGTSLLSSSFKSLPLGIPKLIVSTVASGQTEPYVGTSDLVLFPSIVDVAGVNSVSRVVFSNAAAFAGMVVGRLRSLSDSSRVNDKPTVGITMFGVTTPCVDAVRDRLHREGYESLVFHATGVGGRAMENLIREGFIQVVKKLPVLAGVCATDPFRRMDDFLKQVESIGFSGVQNFPTVGLFNGIFRQNLEETGMGYSLEVEMIQKAHKLGLLTTPYAFNQREAIEMAKVGADIIVAHMGLTTTGSIGAKTAVSLDESVVLVQAIADAAHRINPNTVVLCHGGPISGPEEAEFILKRTKGVHGFYGASSMKRLPVEQAITNTIKQYKSISIH